MHKARSMADFATVHHLRACLYEAGWSVSELAHLQVRTCLPGHNFVNISLRLYVCRAGPPCRDPGYRLRADFSHIDRRNGPTRPRRTRSITFGAVSQKMFPCSFNFTQKNDGTWLLIAGLARCWLTIESLI